MTEKNLLFIDIKAKPKSSTACEGDSKKPLWTHSDNSFRFDFFTDSFSAPQEKASPSDWPEAGNSQLSFTGQSSEFAFNFQIPPGTAAEDMDTTDTVDTCSSHNQQRVKEEKPSLAQEILALPEPSEQLDTKKKKKKSGKKKPSGSETQQKPAEEGDEELTAEEQLNRQLDWCIEKLELGLKTQKGTPKQKEEASRALKTLRSSKAPLAKKRQVMRAMTGDYRKKMDDEKSKQFKLIQSEIASAQVKVVSDSPKKSIFHRRAEVKPQSPAPEGSLQKTKAQEDTKPKPQTRGETADFIFVPSKDEFCFNFL